MLKIDKYDKKKNHFAKDKRKKESFIKSNFKKGSFTINTLVLSISLVNNITGRLR